MLRAIQVAAKDSDGKSDPYLIVKVGTCSNNNNSLVGSHLPCCAALQVGKKEYNLRDKRIMNTLDPEFYERCSALILTALFR